MMTAFMSYLLLDNDAKGRFEALIAAALFRKEPVRWISSPALITLDGPNGSPVQDDWHFRLSWNARDCRHGGYGRGTPPSKKKDLLKARGYSWSAGEFERPKCWYRNVADAEISWLRGNVIGPGQAVWALRITARDRYSDRCWCWEEREQVRTIVPSLPLGTISIANRSP